MANAKPKDIELPKLSQVENEACRRKLVTLLKKYIKVKLSKQWVAVAVKRRKMNYYIKMVKNIPDFTKKTAKCIKKANFIQEKLTVYITKKVKDLLA